MWGLFCSVIVVGSYGFVVNVESGCLFLDWEEEEEKVGERGICGYCVCR